VAHQWATLDVDQANQLLDEIGLTEKDGEGYRQRTTAAGGSGWRSSPSPAPSCPFPRIAQSIAQQWQEIGIQLDVSELERNLGMTRMRNNEHQIFMWANDGLGADLRLPAPRPAGRPAEAMMGR
jgi:peptide/nickel transport system substrate-binding protein